MTQTHHGTAGIDTVESYLAQAGQCLHDLDREMIANAVSRLHECYLSNSVVYAIGNGGSASTAQHFVADLAKYATHPKPGFRALDLGSNLASTTAWTNDEGWDSVYHESLRPWISAGDVLVIFSVNGGSTRSRNLVLAAEQARERGATTIALVGGDGGILGKVADITIHVPDPGPRFLTPLTESMHMTVHHLVVSALRELIAET
ncbi:D-sedoheptulose-7-phosphate isomerase [Saccharomonospora azurea]|uniref:D-sedoheptulose-7-phosphate isomerase n=1 Tax=Saccharomonospora azurea TaxID=40988 RepID=UPI003D8F8D6F